MTSNKRHYTPSRLAKLSGLVLLVTPFFYRIWNDRRFMKPGKKKPSTSAVASIASGQTRFKWDNIYLSKCPCKIVLGLVSTGTQTGNYKKNILKKNF